MIKVGLDSKNEATAKSQSFNQEVFSYLKNIITELWLDFVYPVGLTVIVFSMIGLSIIFWIK